MFNNSDVQKLGALAQEALKGKEFFVGSIVERLKSASNKHPHNQSIRTAEFVFEKIAKAKGSTHIVSQADFQKVYNDVSSLGNRDHFFEELGDLLTESRIGKVASYNSEHINQLRGQGEMLKIAEDSQVAEYESLFGEPNEKSIQAAFAESGRRGIEIELESLGFELPQVAVLKQTTDFVVFAAQVTTAQGVVPFLIPAEVKQGSVLMPSVFVSGNKFVDLTANNIKKHLNSDRKKMKHASPAAVIASLNKMTGKGVVTKTASLNTQEKIPLTSPGYFLDPVAPSTPLPEVIGDRVAHVPLPKGLMALGESMIRETLLEAGTKFSKEIVLLAKTTVANELKLASIYHDSLKIENEFENGLTLTTMITGKHQKKAISIPVEVKNGQVLLPESFMSGPMAGPFNEENLRAFAAKDEFAFSSPFANDKVSMSFKDLQTNMLKNAALSNFVEVTDSLTVISEKFGEELHRFAYDNFMNFLHQGYGEEVESETSFDKFLTASAEKAADKENQIKMTGNALLLYSGD